MKALKAYQHIYLSGQKTHVRYWYYGFLLLLVVVLFLPWTQNIRARGNVLAMRQEQRPQEINTIIGGRIVKWWIKEGDVVKKGDTLLQLAEIKDDYLDPQLLDRTKEQITAKQSSIEFYRNKVGATKMQITALGSAASLKREQLLNKLQQVQLKIQSDSMEAIAAANNLQIAMVQYNRYRALYDSGLVSRTQLEQRNQAYQTAMAKKQSADNTFLATRQERQVVQLEINAIQQDYVEKMAKAESDRLQSLSQIAGGESDLAKLQNQFANYTVRNGMYYILAPQSGQVVQAQKAGIGEVVKEGEMLVKVVPEQIEYVVELFVRPVDLPLIAKGQKVQLIFDGFPAIVFSGWPEASYGTFTGKVLAVENAVSTNGKFRILIAEDINYKPWPKALRVGAGANGMALLQDVPIWYELWRNINSFPPNYYQTTETAKK